MVAKQDGSVWGTGRNYYGELGDESTTKRPSFVKVIPSGVKAIAAGFYHSMVLKQDGSLWAVGWNENGQLGDGSAIDKKTFVKVISSGLLLLLWAFTQALTHPIPNPNPNAILNILLGDVKRGCCVRSGV